jgi:hypothetical protein
MVHATGISKGKGFAGTVKRHNFNTSKKTHGGNGDVRRVGSIGSMYPQKVFKGKRMPGRMGHDQVTVKNLRIAYISLEDNLIGGKGAVPWPKKGLIVLNKKEVLSNGYVKTPAKATTLPKSVFGVDVPNHELVKLAYDAYLANGRWPALPRKLVAR